MYYRDRRTESDPSLQALTSEFAQIVLAGFAPEELIFYEETSQEFFEDPQALLNPKRRDEALGSGLDLAMITPVVIFVAEGVIQCLASAFFDAALKESKPAVMDRLRQLFRRPNADSTTPHLAALTIEQVRQVRSVAYERAIAVGVPPNQASLLADSTAGALVTAE